MQTKREIQELLSAAGVSPNRRLGQHFLVDLNLMRLLVDWAQVGRADVVLEVGCGTGSLTEALAEQAGAVVAVEIDRTLASIAESRLAMSPSSPEPEDGSVKAEDPACSDAARRSSSMGVPPMTQDHGQDARATGCPYGNVQIVNADVLAGKGALNPAVIAALRQAREAVGRSSTGASPVETDDVQGQACPERRRGDGPATHGQSLPSTRSRDAHATTNQRLTHPLRGRLLLVSNLPYDVASPVMIHLARGPVVADAMFVTVQKEVAERMTASPGGRDYGTLSIFLQATGDLETLRVLKPSVFWPPPSVDSALVRFVRNDSKARRIEDMAILSDVVGLFMGHRRKMLRACLKSVPSHLGDPDLWLRILEEHAIDPTLRPGELTCAQYVDLANACRQNTT